MMAVREEAYWRSLPKKETKREREKERARGRREKERGRPVGLAHVESPHTGLSAFFFFRIPTFTPHFP